MIPYTTPIHPPDIDPSEEIEVTFITFRGHVEYALRTIAAVRARYGDAAEAMLSIWWAPPGTPRSGAAACNDNEVLSNQHQDGCYYARTCTIASIETTQEDEEPPPPEQGDMGEDGDEATPPEPKRKKRGDTRGVKWWRCPMEPPAPRERHGGDLRELQTIFARRETELETHLSMVRQGRADADREIDKLRRALRDVEDESARYKRENEALRMELDSARRAGQPLIADGALVELIGLARTYLEIPEGGSATKHLYAIIDAWVATVVQLGASNPELLVEITRKQGANWDKLVTTVNSICAKLGRPAQLPLASEVEREYAEAPLRQFFGVVQEVKRLEELCAHGKANEVDIITLNHTRQMVLELQGRLVEAGMLLPPTQEQAPPQPEPAPEPEPEPEPEERPRPKKKIKKKIVVKKKVRPRSR